MKRIPQFPAELIAMKGGVVAAADAYGSWLRSYYDVRAKWHRRFYRLSGMLVIFVGAALPLLTSLDYPSKTVTISVAGVVVAGLTGLRAFYRWDQSWILLRNSEMAVTAAYLAWKTTPGNCPAADAQAPTPEQEKAANVFIEKLVELRQHESTSYFKNMAFPAVNGTQA
ncbi:DUF4231 domain-containing protein [Lentzea sp. NPDC051213]|uniref:DUF4231 domain-containing protein n=1 Tax=Lentzea sp. NPDC051213 TaxID=3364126 RepID=UPI00379752C3